MRQLDPRPESSTADLVKEAIVEARELIEVEVALARDEINQEISRAKTSGVALGAAAAAALLGLALVLVAIALAISPAPLPALLMGLALIVLAVVVGVVGYGRAPRRPLERTRGRLGSDVRLVRERVV
ncbi:phage holin family protein [Sorangium sp. So ce1078]|uniref:phage holin family protein n=1 Tax=Sorangium sp. So ce1078 TaxID=3133329 RepID=UPI003F620268